VRIVITVPWGERLGGAEAMLQGILEGAAESEHELEPVFFQDGPWPAELRAAGLRVQVIEAGRLREAHRWLSTVRALARLFRERDPDVILNWSAKTHLYGSPAAVLAGMRERVVWWQQAIPKRDWLDGSATLLPAAAVFCYSGAARAAQERLFPRRRTITVAAGSPPPDGDGQPASLPLPDGVPIVGLVGRLQPWKGQDQLLRAQHILRDRGLPMHTLIVGGDSWGLSPEYAASLAPLAAELGIDQDVTMTGEVPDAGPYIRRMDVLVNASDPEPFGIVLLEGMAREVAVVAVNSGGPAEFVQDGVTGVLARSGAPEALADALQRLLVAPELREQIARAGQQRYLAEYTTAALRKRFFARLEEVLSDR
jgi:glycosyltransferase involved in cell wall biosynthesis